VLIVAGPLGNPATLGATKRARFQFRLNIFCNNSYNLSPQVGSIRIGVGKSKIYRAVSTVLRQQTVARGM
jgi:hypothetical protein